MATNIAGRACGRGGALPIGDAPARIKARRLTLGDFQRWAIRPAKLSVPFHQYEVSAKGWAADQGDLFAVGQVA